MDTNELKFPYNYWGLYLHVLERGEEVYQDLLKKYGLNSYDDGEIEEDAYDRFCYSMKYYRTDHPTILANIINDSRIVAAINYICDTCKLDYGDWSWEVNGEIVEVYYKNERIA